MSWAVLSVHERFERFQYRDRADADDFFLGQGTHRQSLADRLNTDGQHQLGRRVA